MLSVPYNKEPDFWNEQVTNEHNLDVREKLKTLQFNTETLNIRMGDQNRMETLGKCVPLAICINYAWTSMSTWKGKDWSGKSM